MTVDKTRKLTGSNGDGSRAISQSLVQVGRLDERPEALQQLARMMLQTLGEDPQRDGLLDTPRRVQESLQFLTNGYDMNPADVVGDALFDDTYDEMVLVRDIELYSLCEHHMLPFFGKAHIAYLPRGKVVGLSKLARLVDVFARRLQVQERLTRQVAEALQEALNPRGVAVMVEASHFCMMM